MLTSAMGRGYERRINGRIVLVNPTPHYRKKVPGLATHQVGFRTQEKYRGYKVRRAKKLVYRLRNQDRKQTSDQVVSAIEDVQTTPRSSTTDHRPAQLASLLGITSLAKWARKNNPLAKVVRPSPKLAPFNFRALTDTQFSTTRILRLPCFLPKLAGLRVRPVIARSPWMEAVARRRKHHLWALIAALRAGGRHPRSSGRRRIQRDRREAMSEPKKLRRAAVGNVLAVQSPDVVRPALVHNPGAVRVDSPSVARRASVHNLGVVGPVLVDIPGMVSPATVHSPGMGESALVYRAGGLGWAFTIYEDPVVQEDVVVERRSSSRRETQWRRI